ncbi:hypothetical protein GCK72_005597 [Caenorhabditis remanei]|uniref:Uncharacterized protein n=1 Tax=Caenorhabditis remanei TaxID=31234 RepID=A0A6A5HFZ2_CAERE|nr:hypothetical protein GCK72_005597 [Caenorhabditis remanei]KAF1765644.1 hypothetical protein GCK72_005597 [Caenorhabditis remanei]
MASEEEIRSNKVLNPDSKMERSNPMEKERGRLGRRCQPVMYHELSVLTSHRTWLRQASLELDKTKENNEWSSFYNIHSNGLKKLMQIVNEIIKLIVDDDSHSPSH